MNLIPEDPMNTASRGRAVAAADLIQSADERARFRVGLQAVGQGDQVENLFAADVCQVEETLHSDTRASRRSSTCCSCRI